MATGDSFDEFLSTYQDLSFEDLVDWASAKPAGVPHLPASSSRLPDELHPPTRQVRPRLDVASTPISFVDLATSSSMDEPPVAVNPTEAPSIEARIKELERKQHNSTRGGRNRLYYEIRAKYGEAHAKAFFVPLEIKASEVNPPPLPKLGGSWWAETIPKAAFVPPPPPPPPAARSSSAASSSVAAPPAKAPWRSRPSSVPEPPKCKAYLRHPL